VKACESDHAAPDPRTARRSCLASNNDWQAASITHATAQQMPVRNLIERDRDSVRLIEQKSRRAGGIGGKDAGFVLDQCRVPDRWEHGHRIEIV
jgi:hypothetical protein